MNTQKGFLVPLIIIIIAALGITGGVYVTQRNKKHIENKSVVPTQLNTEEQFEVSKNTTTDTSTNAAVSSTIQSSSKIKMNMTLAELLTFLKGKDLVCTGSVTSNGGTSSITTYIHGTTIRGDATTTHNGITTKGGVIMKGNDVYAWQGSLGAKLALSANFNLESALSLGGSKSNLNNKSDYTCEPWTVDIRKFTLPSAVTFSDYGAVTIPSVSPEAVKAMMNGKMNY